MRVIAVASGKGGVGKTTIVTNLGAILAEVFKRDVTIIDCNVTTSHLALHLGIYYSPVTLNKVLRGEYPVEDSIFVHFTGLKVIPASLSVDDLKGVDLVKLPEILRQLEEKTEIVLLDAAPGFGREALSAIRAANEILYVTTPYIPAVMDIVRAQEIVREIGVKPIGIVLNMVRGSRHELKAKEIEELVGLPVIAKIKFDENLLKSLALKLPLITYNSKCDSCRELIKLASYLIGEPYVEKSFWRRLLEKLRLRRKI